MQSIDIQRSLTSFLTVAPCDLPFVQPPIVEFFIKETGSYDIVVPDIGGRLHPLHAVYSKKSMPYMLQRFENNRLNITGFINEVQGLSVIRMQMQELVKEDPELRSLFNMNTVEEWREANKVAGRRKRTTTVNRKEV